MTDAPLIGVLALQGAYQAHADRLATLHVDPRLVRHPDQLAALDGLIIPGGESSTFLRHLERDGFFDLLAAFVHERPTFGTCAGAILLAEGVSNPTQRSLAAMDMDVERNAYGRQLDSSILEIETALPGPPLEMVFIRAPRIRRVGPGVQVLARRDADPVLVQQGTLLAATFHPELSAGTRVHQHFLSMVQQNRLLRAESDRT